VSLGLLNGFATVARLSLEHLGLSAKISALPDTANAPQTLAKLGLGV
jgi:hypothetical protein